MIHIEQNYVPSPALYYNWNQEEDSSNHRKGITALHHWTSMWQNCLCSPVTFPSIRHNDPGMKGVHIQDKHGQTEFYCFIQNQPFFWKRQRPWLRCLRPKILGKDTVQDMSRTSSIFGVFTWGHMPVKFGHRWQKRSLNA